MGKSDPDHGANPNTDLKPPLKEPESVPTIARIIKEPIAIKKRQSFQNVNADQTLALPSWFGLEDLEEKVVSMMEKSQHHFDNGKQPAYICKVCGKESRHKNMKDHIEANHLEGVAIPCNLCDKTFRSKNGLRQHMMKHKVTP